MDSDHRTDPLSAVLPIADDRRRWGLTGTAVAVDTREPVFVYRHHRSGRTLLLDRRVRVYGQDAEGAVRLFGKGGRLALAVALNAVFDGMDTDRPTTVTLPADQPAR